VLSHHWLWWGFASDGDRKSKARSGQQSLLTVQDLAPEYQQQQTDGGHTHFQLSGLPPHPHESWIPDGVHKKRPNNKKNNSYLVQQSKLLI
jgi:hypothetical protein